MRFKVGNWKFGHIPFSKPSRTELARKAAVDQSDAGEPEPLNPLSSQACNPRTNLEHRVRNSVLPALDSSPKWKQLPTQPEGLEVMPPPRRTEGFEPPAWKQMPIQLEGLKVMPLPCRTEGFESQVLTRSPPQTLMAGRKGVSRQEIASPPKSPEEERSIIEGRLYKAVNLKSISQTSIVYRDSDLVKGLEPLGSGTFNTVFSLELNNGSGAPLKGVFKPLAAEDNGWVLQQTGVDLHDPQIAMRNLATVAYAKKLGFDVISDTKVALFTVPEKTTGGIEAFTPKLGLLMHEATGKLGRDLSREDLQNPEVIRELTKLQLVDNLTAQGDRNKENYFVDIDKNTHKVKVTGIDNDQCFGHLVSNPESMVNYSSVPNVCSSMKGFRAVNMPPFVDVKMFNAIMDITPQDLRGTLHHMLSAREVEASVQRLNAVKDHLKELVKNGCCLIDEADWGSQKVSDSLRSHNSYAKRESYFTPSQTKPNGMGQW